MLIQENGVNTNLKKGFAKLQEFVQDAIASGWIVKGYRFSIIKGKAKLGVDIQNTNGEILQFNTQC